jgi:hypothetical protein
MSVGDHRDYRNHLIENPANLCYLAIIGAFDSEIKNCSETERFRGQPLPDSEVKVIKDSKNKRLPAKIRPSELLYSIPSKEDLKKKFEKLDSQDLENYQVIFHKTVKLLIASFEGYYAQALLDCEEIKLINESRILQHHVLLQVPSVSGKQLKLEYPKPKYKPRSAL